ncbi:DUF5946 family protein [Nocardia sp. NBC_01377]|uniref:DUF5946 family protein n=1 Tax=Nocardia sp. NBC_01377 TaxID=2903595 RepID=UPI0032442D8F
MSPTFVAGIEVPACECGAAMPCIDSWHAALAVEQSDPMMYAWHAPLVCAFVLQHRSRLLPRHADGQFRILQFYVDQGIEATNRLAQHQISRNRRSASGYDMEPLAPYTALPKSVPPADFPLGVNDLRDSAGGFVSDGHRAYGDRMYRLAQTTIRAWLRPREQS